MTQTIAITGATGFVGRRTVDRLSSGGHRLKLLARRPEVLGHVTGAEVIAGDLNELAALDQLVSDVDAVIHIAGAIQAPNRQAYDVVNVTGTANVAEAAARARVRRFVHLSSMAAREPGLSDYGASKLAGEAALQGHAGEISWVALRPPAVYGPGDKATLPLIQQFLNRHAFLPGTAQGRASLVHVDDLADALIAMASSDQPLGSIHEVHDGKVGGYSWREMAEIVGAAEGDAAKVHHLPKGLLMFVAGIAGWYAGVTGSAAMLSPGKVNELYHSDWVARHSLLEEASDWRPRIGFAEGVVQTLQWYREHQWLPTRNGRTRNSNQRETQA